MGYFLSLAAWMTLILAGFGWELLVLWILPLTVGFQIAGLLQISTEHRWAAPEGDARGKTFNRKTVVPAPKSGSKWIGWILWSWKSLNAFSLGHFAYPFHDLRDHEGHHKHPGRDPLRVPPQPTPESMKNRVTWGLTEALNVGFLDLHQLPPTAIVGFPETYGPRPLS